MADVQYVHQMASRFPEDFLVSLVGRGHQCGSGNTVFRAMFITLAKQDLIWKVLCQLSVEW